MNLRLNNSIMCFQLQFGEHVGKWKMFLYSSFLIFRDTLCNITQLIKSKLTQDSTQEN